MSKPAIRFTAIICTCISFTLIAGALGLSQQAKDELVQSALSLVNQGKIKTVDHRTITTNDLVLIDVVHYADMPSNRVTVLFRVNLHPGTFLQETDHTLRMDFNVNGDYIGCLDSLEHDDTKVNTQPLPAYAKPGAAE